MSYWGVRLASADASLFVVTFLVISFVGAFIVMYGLVFLAVVLFALGVELVHKAWAKHQAKRGHDVER